MTDNKQTEYSAETMPLISDESMPGGGCIINAMLGGSVLHCSEAGASTMSVAVSAYVVKLTPLNAPGATVRRRSCGQRLPHPIPEATPFAQPYRLLYTNPPRTGLKP